MTLTDEAVTTRSHRARRPSWPVLPLVLALVLALAGAGLLVAAGGPGGGEKAPANRALVDTEATTKVAGDVGTALSRIFSYTPDDIAGTERAANEVLTGAAAKQYRQLFDGVRQQAPAQRVTLTSRVVRTGVTSLTGGTARLLVFLDQTSTRKGKKATTAAAQLTVTAARRGGRWLITDIKSS
ncbi:hypothetical protein [Actinomadura macrotermitis]|uniref:Mce-associated membrane protein n=1 Tax=Actinomadura macrotermitis TaxID=2585200 RepID=A0A7K0BS74_9ACTN|nr:hypothetical protein [Actinomadura macrotermitis]MQY04055.1 hypothetical protein [Actinomadura macrotermitis]